MTLRRRKLILVGSIMAIFVLANAYVFAAWLGEFGVVSFATHLRSEYITAAAIGVMAAMLIMLPSTSRKKQGSRFSLGRCPVCDEHLRSGGKYCPSCGSRV